jgi:tetratricopeptide (TPR) repeat protein
LATAAISIQAAQARDPVDRTGSRVGSDSTRRMIIQFAGPGEIDRVLHLLEQDQTDEAIVVAQDYLKSLDSAAFVGNSSVFAERYSALNALCAAFTKARRLDEALAACTAAIEMNPSRWSALNNRGTAHFSSGEFQLALADYRRAREVAPRREGVVATIEHNIRLAEQRLE